MYQPPHFREDRIEVQHALIREYPLGLLIPAAAGGLMGVEECMAVFQGPQSYITPSWYAAKRETGKVVPTWNYATVHVWGRPSVIEDAAWLRRQIDGLTALQEGRRAAPWSVSDAPDDFVAAQMRGIVGV